VYDLIVDAAQRDFRKATRVVTNPMLPLPGLSPVGAKKIMVQFDGGLLSSNAGVLVCARSSTHVGGFAFLAQRQLWSRIYES
jgi:hypothetical protein